MCVHAWRPTTPDPTPHERGTADAHADVGEDVEEGKDDDGLARKGREEEAGHHLEQRRVLRQPRRHAVVKEKGKTRLGGSG